MAVHPRGRPEQFTYMPEFWVRPEMGRRSLASVLELNGMEAAMQRPIDLLPAFGTETGWRRIQNHLPRTLRLDDSAAPTEEWLSVGAFSIRLDC